MARPLTEPLRQVLAATNAALGTAFNGLLVNLYADGTETIGAHSDSEVGLGKDGSVAALSLGAERIFRVKCKATKKTLADIRTRHGQLLVMEKVHFQRECTHEITVQKNHSWTTGVHHVSPACACHRVWAEVVAAMATAWAAAVMGFTVDTAVGGHQNACTELRARWASTYAGAAA